ncbi:MAG TPA: GAF domain-containing protein [Acidobacteriaceae bacterium]|nr:GAF domain-containing protein [Acidobacteriaceae bacterium]
MTPQQDTGMELRDLLADPDFPTRPRRLRDPHQYVEAVSRLARVFAEQPEAVLQELVEIAVRYCGADSAGISLEEILPTGEKKFRWVAIAGSFAQYLHGTTPRFFSPCGTCLDAERPQLYRVTQPYYDFLGVTADEITDGLLIPWINEFHRGTIWAIAHHSREAFDLEDYRLLSTLADFASMALRHQQQQQLLREQEKLAAATARSNELAHLINNPLQSLVNTLYLAQHAGPAGEPWVKEALDQLSVLSRLVSQLLDISPRVPNKEDAHSMAA